MIQIDEGRVITGEATGANIPFNNINVGKCRCLKCPVQAKSQCVADKLSTIGESVIKKPLIREDIPGVYCSTGMATCTDLDPRQTCLCPTCAVFAEYDLFAGTPVNHYCRGGRVR